MACVIQAFFSQILERHYVKTCFYNHACPAKKTFVSEALEDSWVDVFLVSSTEHYIVVIIVLESLDS